MDHLSSSSSSTSTNTYTNRSVSTFQQDVPKQTYTTAGTIYRPGNSQPLQPPIRRGRNIKWSSTGGPASELSLFPKSVLAGLPLKAQSLVAKTPTSPLSHHVPKYSPLQQNYDRAVSPALDHTNHARELVVDLDTSSQPPALMPPLKMDGKKTSPAAVTMSMPRPILNKSIEADSSDDEDDEVSGENPLKGLPVKSLHNLASYPNPNQKRAQKALFCVRPGAPLVSSASTNISRTSTPFHGLPSFEASDMGKDGTQSSGLFYSAKLDPTGILKTPAEMRSDRDAATWRVDGPTPPPGLFPAQHAQRYNSTTTYKSTLATGPGAPRPLTAGPPGQRQYRTSTFEPTMKSFNCGTTTEAANDDGLAADTGPVFYGMRKTISPDSLGFSGTATPDHLNVELPSLLPNSTPDLDPPNHNAMASILIEDILDVIKHGGIRGTSDTDVCRPGSLITSDIPTFSGEGWVEDHPRRDRPVWAPGTSRIADEELQRRNERINRLFHAGTGELGRSLEAVVRDAEFRQFKRRVGVIGDRRPKSKPVKVEYPPISISRANEMTEKEAAEPFVSLAFSSLVNHVEGGINHVPFNQWKDPEAELLDTSAKGRQSLFGN
ncbi:hypothetical protein CCHL11_00565 [Colletotrichum chlorophyti]|uniref:Uncharacterized protein n=1 Tax=Colletotrichum chlorophyti TaxID=708187 RepID=A0A1Q8S4U9_9PEZI|nr:hypothetical protein CCHL11_00565 [Colletotrichum chlorophyti]